MQTLTHTYWWKNYRPTERNRSYIVKSQYSNKIQITFILQEDGTVCNRQSIGLEIKGSTTGQPPLHSNLGQDIHTYVPLVIKRYNLVLLFRWTNGDHYLQPGS